MSNPLTSAQFVRLLDKRLREVAEGQYTDLSKREDMIDKFYRKVPSDGAWEEFFSVGALPDIPEFTGKLEYLSKSSGYHIKIEPKEYAAGVQIERKLIDDKKYPVLDGWAADMGESAFRTMQKIAVRPFAYATSSAFDYMTHEEAVSLASTAHTTKSGTSTASGFSNSGSSALSKTSVAASRLLMRKFRNDISERIVIEPDTLIVPDALYDTALEITGSEKDPESAENAINPQYKRFKVIPWLRLDDTDSNNWGMADSKLMKKWLIWIDRINPEFHNTIDFETFEIKHSTYFRCANGFIDWRFLYWNTVS